jgi:hypothetical protein
VAIACGSTPPKHSKHDYTPADCQTMSCSVCTGKVGAASSTSVSIDTSMLCAAPTGEIACRTIAEADGTSGQLAHGDELVGDKSPAFCTGEWTSAGLLENIGLPNRQKAGFVSNCLSWATVASECCWLVSKLSCPRSAAKHAQLVYWAEVCRNHTATS